MECRICTGLFLRFAPTASAYPFGQLSGLRHGYRSGRAVVYDGCGVAWRSGDLLAVVFLASRRFGAMGKIRSDGRVVCCLAIHLYFAFALLGRPRQHCRSFRFGGGVRILPTQTRAECVYHICLGQCIVRPVAASRHHL